MDLLIDDGDLWILTVAAYQWLKANPDNPNVAQVRAARDKAAALRDEAQKRRSE